MSRTCLELTLLALLIGGMAACHEIEGFDSAAFVCPDGLNACGGACVQDAIDHCGSTCAICPAPGPNSAAQCLDGQCAYGCLGDFGDPNGDQALGNQGDGCECAKTNGGIETCDGVDNNCDGAVDEGVKNGCGGCELLNGAPGEICGQQCDNPGIWACRGQDLIVCQGEGVNGCGGCDLVDFVPDEACGICGIARCQPNLDLLCIEETTTFFFDGDNDGFGADPDDFIEQCEGDAPEANYTAQELGDCNDGDPDRHPGAPQRCNSLDNDCDGSTDDFNSCPLQLGVCLGSRVPCNSNDLTCDDTLYRTLNGGFEGDDEVKCDDRDNDCDGLTDENCCPPDQDAFLVPAPNDPTHPQTSPAMALTPNGDAVLVWHELGDLFTASLSPQGALLKLRTRLDQGDTSNVQIVTSNQPPGFHLLYKKSGRLVWAFLDSEGMRRNPTGLPDNTLDATITSLGDLNKALALWSSFDQINTHTITAEEFGEGGGNGRQPFIGLPINPKSLRATVGLDPHRALVAWHDATNALIQWLFYDGQEVNVDETPPERIRMSAQIPAPSPALLTHADQYLLAFFDTDVIKILVLDNQGQPVGIPLTYPTALGRELVAFPVGDRRAALAWITTEGERSTLKLVVVELGEDPLIDPNSFKNLGAFRDMSPQPLAVSPGPATTSPTFKWFAVAADSKPETSAAERVRLRLFNAKGDPICFLP